MTFKTGNLTFEVGDPITYTDSSNGNIYSGYVGKLSSQFVCSLDEELMKKDGKSPAEYCIPGGSGQN